MENKNKIGLLTATLININIMLGAGLFINPNPLTQLAGPFGFLGYLLGALVLLPIVLSLAELAKFHPTAGGIYVYSKTYINNSVGFLSGWSYFLGKTTSAALLANTLVSFFYKDFLFLQKMPILFWDALLISFLIMINILGVSIGGKIQYLFTSLKAIPVTFVIFTGFYFFNINFFSNLSIQQLDILGTIPVALFALTSFEISCSIGHLIKNPEKNIKRSMLLSFFIIGTIAIIFQFLMYGALGNVLANIQTPVGTLATNCFSSILFLPALLNTLVFTSIISGSFGSLTSNCWNLYALANDKMLPFSKILTKISKTNTPWVSLIFEGALACLLLAISKTQITLQNMTIFSMVTAYLCSSIASFNVLKIKKGKFKLILPALAILSSSYIIWLCLQRIFKSGVSFPFLLIFLSGIFFALYKNQINKKS